MTSFHNTIGESGETLLVSNENCKTQEEKILDIFRVLDDKLTPFEVCYAYNSIYAPIPITSVRRAITNLTEQNKLIKTSDMKNEVYNKRNFTWIYNKSFGA